VGKFGNFDARRDRAIGADRFGSSGMGAGRRTWTFRELEQVEAGSGRGVRFVGGVRTCDVHVANQRRKPIRRGVPVICRGTTPSRASSRTED
jgi:hypothetical protein